MNALIVYGSNYNVAVYCSINYVPKSKKSLRKESKVVQTKKQYGDKI